MNQAEHLYGILHERNINEVQFGCDKRFSTWYGSNVYFDADNKMIKATNSKQANFKKYMYSKKRAKGNDGKQIDIGQDDANVKPESKINDNDNENIEINDKENTSNNNDGNQNDPYWLDVIYICEYCFKYCDNAESLIDHTKVCTFKEKVPGRLKYLGPKYQIRRVKGQKHTLFCQCLCLFTKLFLDDKSMYFRIANYEFYIIYENGSTKPMGFFSKDIVSYNKNNLACILVFPPYQKRKLGTILIELSYKISKFEGLKSSPEVPLSPFGLITYMNFWSNRICWELLEGELADLGSVTIEDISTVTGFKPYDIVQTLQYLDCIDAAGNIQLSRMIEKVSSKHGKVSNSIIQDEHLLLGD
ncbi:hypothetical protein TPHA_0G02720 [Tetrapisispora phaffii CBS 4417]|uniref:histone acetyltransferase n=1 Tax=Tetrapisispora phaffii (strain ATCC 24235 / CBS 4417 / NBRC 1672 / NRRL Y-8282 / UCD 70-5) TaxID=1071381 RepID=G8BW31_TETPH|nr:hypothetical protein TPHA_0G02720 [Tetrapisispora phaffii CBS 4417]CCE64109.1 hypothetical protein TPHA_0G02720 [Tetrapisispora phaffii CBS 4417]